MLTETAEKPAVDIVRQALDGPRRRMDSLLWAFTVPLVLQSEIFPSEKSSEKMVSALAPEDWVSKAAKTTAHDSVLMGVPFLFLRLVAWEVLLPVMRARVIRIGQGRVIG
ncbi:hypothetical protein MNKW57_21330 [Biformimicrobium ophioploci]|uniref:Uncharacterized protein n=1 Tax=Biformimicrobium ophioploci TaxID=3036711 RepID=A0ABQ6M0F7_9GAMM|nr:hypothetical protein MNKW57_21330 [Microbulbifer sp. NKW57]